MFRKYLISANQTKSIFLLLVGTIILAILLGFDPFSFNSDSTGFTDKINVFYFIKNEIANGLLQFFGISIYIVPITLLIWSYKLFFNKLIKNLRLKIFLILFNLLILPVIIGILFGENYTGILGAFLLYNFYFINNYILLFLCFVSVIFLAITFSITFKDLEVSIKLIGFISNKFLKISLKYTKNFRASLYQSINFSKKEKEKTSSSVKDLEKVIQSLEEEDLTENYIENPFIKKTTNTLEQEKQEYSPISTLKDNINSNNKLSPYDIHYKSNHLSNVNNQDNIDNKLTSRFNEEQKLIKNKANDTSFIISEDKKSKIKSDAFESYKITRFNNYSLPTTLLDYKDEKMHTNSQEIKNTAIKLESVIKEFGIEGKIVNIQTGPVVTLFEIAIPPGVKTSKVTGLEADISLRMKAFSVRIAIVPGKDVIGIEIPNSKRKTVYLKKLLDSKYFINSSYALPINLGYDISGKPVIADLATMPHLLVAGTTGSGKSVAVNAMILSLLYKLNPEQCKMIMIDPKMLELSIYQDIPHLLTPVVTDSKKAIYALKWAVKQMEQRYTLMSHLGVRNVNNYNEKIQDSNAIAELTERLRVIHNIELEFSYMPYIVIIIDEMADLMLVAGKEIESAVQRLAQMARAAGIHLIMATQRPSVDVITGTIKANFPTRISFQVSSKIDSRTILGEQGAERLLGKGDMLYMMGVGRLQRVHGPFVSDTEVEKVVTILRKMASPSYIDEVTKDEENLDNTNIENTDTDELYNDVVDLIKQEGKVSTSYIQRRFQIGYNRAARIVDMLEQNGIISKPTSTGKREILIN